jgi:competence CoiA-like predicted nuclease
MPLKQQRVMISKEQLIREIEQIPDFLVEEVLDFARYLTAHLSS